MVSCLLTGTRISLSFYAHYSVTIHFLPKLFGTCQLFIILNIHCNFWWILWELIFYHYQNSILSLTLHHLVSLIWLIAVGPVVSKQQTYMNIHQALVFAAFHIKVISLSFHILFLILGTCHFRLYFCSWKASNQKQNLLKVDW